MRIFRFQKLYMDLIDADGTVCIAYAAELHALGLRRHFGGIELYASNGERKIHRARDVVWSSTDETTEIRGSFRDGQFSMRHHRTESGWEPEGAPACRGLSWRVLGARANAAVELTRAGASRHFSGTGYSDWVTLTRPTRWLGLAKVEWGRFHLPNETFIFNRIAPERGETWQRALSIRDGSRVETSSVAIDGDRAAIVYRSAQDELALSSTRLLHDGPALDRERLPGALERHLSNLITGPAAERRLVGRARRTSSPAEDAQGFGIVEVVRFGASAPRAPGE